MTDVQIGRRIVDGCRDVVVAFTGIAHKKPPKK
jgi:hypothetical protein